MVVGAAAVPGGEHWKVVLGSATPRDDNRSTTTRNRQRRGAQGGQRDWRRGRGESMMAKIGKQGTDEARECGR